MFLRSLSFIAVSFCLATVSAAEVTKLVSDFSRGDWQRSQWNKAGGATFTEANDAAPGAQGGYLRADVKFSGAEFQWHSLEPSSPIVIPGKAKRIELWVKGGQGYPITMTFKDGWGRDKNGSTKLEWSIQHDAQKWQKVAFDVPQDWIFPISIAGLTTHNHSSQNIKKELSFFYDDLSVTSDISDVDPKSGKLKGWQKNPEKADFNEPIAKLFDASVVSKNMSHVFAGENPAFSLSAQIWTAGVSEGSLHYVVSDWRGQSVDENKIPLRVDGQALVEFTPKLPLFGQYQLAVDATFENGSQSKETIKFAYLPAVQSLTEEEQQLSPYGLNVHGGRLVRPSVFVKAGIQWYRDYAFAYGWTQKSQGADNSFTGWPNHRAIFDAYKNAGVKYLACVMKFIPRPEADQKPGSMPAPDAAFVQHLKEVCKAFPEIKYWEVDNEYELGEAAERYEKSVNWKHYHDYHQAFAEAIDEASSGESITVENGRGGIWPELVKNAVASGAFNKVGVINSHHYTGTDSPERNVGNHNTSFGDAFSNHQAPELFFDHLRAVSRAADSDGINREHWLTEFGWDDLAGPKVPSDVKAAYLPRGYMVVLASGTDKGFWFFDYSGEPEKAKQFFDGCGLLDHNQQPESALAAMAGMTSILPAPTYIGSVILENGVSGHVFKNRGQLVAALFTDLPETATVNYEFNAEAVYDWYANKLASPKVDLSLRPTYAVGIKPEDLLYQQTAYSLDSNAYIQASAGDTFVASVRVANNRSGKLNSTLSVDVPEAWTLGAFDASLSLAVGEEKIINIPVTLSKDQSIGETQLVIHAKENGKRIKSTPIRVFVVNPVFYEVSAITGEPGKTELTVRLLNQSVSALNAELQLVLPASWKVAEKNIKVSDLASAAVKNIKIPIEWSTDIQTGEEASVDIVIAGFPKQSKAIIPNHLNLKKLNNVKIDGDISDLPASAELPAWMVGYRGIAKDAKIYAGWKEEGLYLAVKVENSKSYVTNPRTFWEGDALELFLGTSGEKDERAYRKDDHQFWIIPLVKENRVYLGRWKRGDSIAETQYDIQAIEGSAVKTENGYIMEVLIKKDAMVNWQPKVGGRLGVVLSLTAVGIQDGKREIFWPMTKQSGSSDQPGYWGAWHLKE